ncbi:MAG: hypothetical protein D6732_18665 [Methanobacteriota archaeon]|nr:MAG: hypothetical protein D6732_18665 [Euryarchaeota archaeon]
MSLSKKTVDLFLLSPFLRLFFRPVHIMVYSLNSSLVPKTVMFKGEPVAIWAMFSAFVSFLALQLYGILFGLGLITSFYPIHFHLAIFGWITFLILGAELQFFRAILAIRKFEPEVFRWIFLISVYLSVFLTILSGWINLLAWAYGFLLIATVVHTFWLGKYSRSRFFKFPLQFYLAGQVFFILGLLLYAQFVPGLQFEFHNLARWQVMHIFAVGWISLVLQGAVTRILPMFLNRAIDRSYRPRIDKHFWFSLSSSTLFISGIIMESFPLLVIGGSLWYINWILVVYFMVRSLVTTNRGKNLSYPVTGIFFLWGFIWLAIGSTLGTLSALEDFGFMSDLSIRDFHIHTSLLLGLSFIMMGAYHRISAFQVYTILFSGKRGETSLHSMLHEKLLFVVFVLSAMGGVIAAIGFYLSDFHVVAYGGILHLLGTLLLFGQVVWVLKLYVSQKGNAVPFYLKSTEVK